MKTRTIVLVVLLASTALLALAPNAAATNQACTYKSPSCPGIVCAVYDRSTQTYAKCVPEPIVCVTDPCWPYP